MQLREVTFDGRRTRVWVGGEGQPLLLLHGAWGDAQSHWAGVWDALSERHLVVAPDFPGIADDTPWVPSTFDESAGWAEGVLGALGLPSAWVLGNSFGAAVAARLASREPRLCLGLVLVNGMPAPHLPGPLRAVGRRRPFRRGMEGLLGRLAYGQGAAERAFADSANIPPSIDRILAQRRPRQLLVTSRILLAADRSTGLPAVRTLLLWGVADTLSGSSVADARRLQQRLDDARLIEIADAGHLPQLEQPDAFVAGLLDFTGCPEFARP